jgi:hypothetical protein
MLEVHLTLNCDMIDKSSLISLVISIQILLVIDLIGRVLVGHVNSLGDH